MKETIAIWFSCGAASAVAAKKTIEKYGNTHNIIIVNNQIHEEDSDNLRFLKDCQKWFGLPIWFANNPEYPTNSVVDVWEKKRFMSNRFGAPCTVALKKEARHLFEVAHKIDWHVLGFTIEELHRHNRFVKRERDNVLPILIDLDFTKQDCFDELAAAGIDLPNMYKMGYPNANCPGCVKATSPTYWNHVRIRHPEVFKQRAEQSRRLGCKLVRYKGKMIFLDELPPDAKGRKMKSYECGIFCDTK